MVKSLLNMCLEIVQKPCAFETDLDLYWLNCGLRCIPFKFYNKLVADDLLIAFAKEEFLK